MARTLIAKFSSAGGAEHASEKLLMLGYGSEVHELDSIRLARYIASTEYCTERDTGCMEDHATFAARTSRTVSFSCAALRVIRCGCAQARSVVGFALALYTNRDRRGRRRDGPH